MSGSSVTELLQSRGDPVQQSPVIRGRIAGRSNEAGHFTPTAPTAFPTVGSALNLVWVIAPGYSQDHPLGPCWWGAEHGATLPQLAAECVVVTDNEGQTSVVSWQGNHS